MVLQITPTLKQYEAYQKLLDQQTIYVLYGGAAGGGKSFLGCEWIFGNAIAYPGTVWFIGRQELNDLRIHTNQSVYEFLEKREITPSAYFRFNAQDNIFYFHNGSIVKYLELKQKPSDPQFESLGSTQFTGGWIEEAGQVSYKAFDVLKSRIGRWRNDQYNLPKKILLTCNPTKNWLYAEFYKPWKEAVLPKEKAFIQSLVTDNPHRQSGYEHTLEQITDFVNRQRLRYGNWEYADDENNLFRFEQITDLFTNEHAEKGTKYISADIARFGKDKSILLVWEGMQVIDIVVLTKQPTDVTASTIKTLATKYRIPLSQVVIDADGIGGGVVDQLKGVRSFVGNSTPLLNNNQKENYQNLKAQCYYKLSQEVANIYIKPTVATKDIDGKTFRELLTEELGVIRRKNPDSDGKLQITPKEEQKKLLGRSPDLADTIMYRMYFTTGQSQKITSRTKSFSVEWVKEERYRNQFLS